MPGTSLGALYAICDNYCVFLFPASRLVPELKWEMYHLECARTLLTLHPSLTVTRLATTFPPVLPPVLYAILAQPCPSPRFLQSPWPHRLPPEQPASPLAPASPVPPLCSHPSASLPQPHPSMPARSLPPNPPPVSPSPALTWEVRGVGDG